MDEFLEINCISPISNYKFNSIKRYYLIIISTGRNNLITIYKIHLININNINSKTRGYIINKSINNLAYQYPKLNIKLFEHDILNKKIKLMFSNDIDSNDI